MSGSVLRSPSAGEKPLLYSIWDTVFGSVGKDSFFDCFYNDDLCVLAEFEGTAASVGYLVPTGEILHGSISVPCAMIYSVATLHMYRGMGIGTAVVRELIRVANKLGFPAVVLCPMNDELFGFYSKRTGMRDFFYIGERIADCGQGCEPACVDPAGLKYLKEPKDLKEPKEPKDLKELNEVSANEYLRLRENLLAGSVHIKQDIKILEYQIMLCNELGGGLFRFGDSCAAVELQENGGVWIKELLSSGPDADDFVSAIAAMFPAHEYTVRFPSNLNEGRRFGMLDLQDDVFGDLSNITPAPWYGMAFD